MVNGQINHMECDLVRWIKTLEMHCHFADIFERVDSVRVTNERLNLKLVKKRLYVS